MRSRQFVQPKLALNHVTAPNLGWRELLDLAKRIGCSGVELRNDLDRPLFDGDDPEVVGKAAVVSPADSVPAARPVMT